MTTMVDWDEVKSQGAYPNIAVEARHWNVRMNGGCS